MTLNKALEIAQAAEATQSQLKQMQNLHEVNAMGKKKGKFFRKKQEEKKKSANGSTQQIDCKVCGRKHVPDRSRALHMANSATSVEKATILLLSVQEEGSPIRIELCARRFRWESI